MTRITLTLLAVLAVCCSFPVAPHPALAAPTVRLALTVQGRSSFPLNGLVDVGITIQNVSKHDIQLALTSCSRSFLGVDQLDAHGKVLPAALPDAPSPDCSPPSPSKPVHPGGSVSGGGALVLRSAHLRPFAMLWVNGQVVTVRGSVTTIPVHAAAAARAVLHTKPVLYADIWPSTQAFPVTYRYWYSCLTGAGTRYAETVPAEPLNWLVGQAGSITPRFRADCVRVLGWHAVAGYLFNGIATVDDTRPYDLSAPPAQSSSAANVHTPKGQILAAFQALDASPGFRAATETKYRISAGPNKDDVFTTETVDRAYVAPDRFEATSHGLSPVGKPETQMYVQIGPVICNLEPFNFPKHTWQAYPYDLFTYQNHRPNVGRTVLQVPREIEQPSSQDPRRVTSFTLSSSVTTINGQQRATRTVRIRLSYPIAGEAIPPPIRYKGHIYIPTIGAEQDTLVFDASSNLPLLVTGTNTVNIGSGKNVTVQHTRTTYDYTVVPTIDPVAPACG